MPLNRRHVLSILLADGEAPPEKFRLFKAGVNKTRKGDFIFDEESARSVMADYAEHGVDLMMDLEHLSVAPLAVTGDGRSFNSDSQCWFGLTIQNGECWADPAKWTPEGTQRVVNRSQRFVSPCFDTDDENRIIRIFNVALTSTPATDDAPALIAASQRLKMPAPAENTEGTKGKAASVREAIAAAITAMQDADKALNGGDIDAMFSAIEAAQPLVDAFEKAAAALVPGLQDEGMAPPAEGSDEEKAMKATVSQLSAITGESSALEILSKIKSFKASHTKLASEQAKLAADRLAMEVIERKELVASMVRLGAEAPATAYADREATKIAEPWASMALAQLRDRVQRLSGGALPTRKGTLVPATSGIVQLNGLEVSEFELNRLKRTCSRLGTKFEDAEEKYLGHRVQQLKGAQESGTASRELLKRFSASVLEEHVLVNNYGQRVTLAQSPVQPIQEFGASSQRALEEFRLEYNVSLAAQPVSWAEAIGQLLPSGALKETYPISFKVAGYREKTTTPAAARTATSKDITVQKRIFSDSHEVELRKLKDFANILSWQQNAQLLAAARIYLRSELVVALLALNPLWVDGKAFFATDHPVHPTDANMAFRGVKTWGNLQGSANPLGAGVLTTEKSAFYSIPGPNGKELGIECDCLLVPSMLKETANNLLKVQDLILAAATTKDGVSNVMGQVKNPHFMSGMEYIRAPELPGTGVTADYYLLSKQAFARGLIPWVISEDPTEEVKVWDESSDFYKDTDFIKYESIVQVNATLLYPHGIRMVKGA